MESQVAGHEGRQVSLLSCAEVARYLRRTPRQIRRLKASRSIPFVKRADARVLFPVAWIDAWVGGSELEVVEVSDGVVVRPRLLLGADRAA